MRFLTEKGEHGKGFFWSERFKSVIVDNGETLINCLAYIDLNPIRTGIAEKPEEYRWCSLSYHAQTHNRDRFLSTDLGLREFAPSEIRGAVTGELHPDGIRKKVHSIGQARQALI